jgi:hypothetical protein
MAAKTGAMPGTAAMTALIGEFDRHVFALDMISVFESLAKSAETVCAGSSDVD